MKAPPMNSSSPPYASVEPVTAEFLRWVDSKGLPAIETGSAAEGRRMLSRVQSSAPPPALPVLIRDLAIPGGPTGSVPLRLVRPSGVPLEVLLPGVVYVHGGGWTLGSVETHARLVEEIALRVPAEVVFVSYSLSPEHRYPIALEEIYRATTFVARAGESLGIDGGRLAAVGDSAGGNLAAALTLLAKRRGGPRLLHQVLLYPVTAPDFDVPSYRRFADGPWLTRSAMEWYWDNYVPRGPVREMSTVSPLRASLMELRDLPPALVVTADNDVLRDEGEAYARKLMAAGVPTVAVRYLGTIHDFLLLNALSDSPAIVAALQQVVDILRTALYDKPVNNRVGPA